jgi:hypothetical protein
MHTHPPASPPGARLIRELSTEIELAVSTRGEVIAVHPSFLLPELVRLDDLRPATPRSP